MSTVESLRRELGLIDAVAIGLGSMMGAGIFVVWGPAVASAGGWFLASVVIAGAVAWCNAMSTAALAARMPASGGAYLFGKMRVGDLVGYLAGWCFVVGKTASCAAMAITVAAYAVPGAEKIAGAVAVIAMTVLNLQGVQRTATVTRVLAAIVVAALIGVVAAGLATGTGVAGESTTPDVGVYGVLQAAGLLFFAFAGYARIATMAEEVENPERTIPRAVLLALSVTLIVYFGVGWTVVDVLGVEATASSGAPVADAVREMTGSAGAVIVSVVAVIAGLAALLNLMLGISRTTLAMARGGHLPKVFATLAGPRRVPRLAEVSVGLVVLVVVLAVDLRGAIGFSSFGVLLYYSVAHAAAWTLRGDWAWASWLPLVGLAGCLMLVATLPVGSVIGGLIVVGLGVVAYPFTKRWRPEVTSAWQRSGT